MVNKTKMSKTLDESHNAHIKKTLLDKYMSLPIPEGKIQATFWIDGTGENLRCKDRTLELIPEKPSDLPIWNYDGSSCYQAEGHNSDVYLHPVAIFKDPMRPGNNILVMCETYRFDGTPTESNKRRTCREVCDKVADEQPWFGIEQEYTLLNVDGRPLG